MYASWFITKVILLNH